MALGHSKNQEDTLYNQIFLLYPGTCLQTEIIFSSKNSPLTQKDILRKKYSSFFQRMLVCEDESLCQEYNRYVALRSTDGEAPK